MAVGVFQQTIFWLALASVLSAGGSSPASSVTATTGSENAAANNSSTTQASASSSLTIAVEKSEESDEGWHSCADILTEVGTSLDSAFFSCKEDKFEGPTCGEAVEAYKLVVQCAGSLRDAFEQKAAQAGELSDGDEPAPAETGTRTWFGGGALSDADLKAITLAHLRLGELYFGHFGNLEASLHYFRRGAVFDEELGFRKLGRVANESTAVTLKTVSSKFEHCVHQTLDVAYSINAGLHGDSVRWKDIGAVYWFSLLFTVIPFLLTTYTVTHYGEDFGRLASAFKNKFLEQQFWREEDQNSLQRANFFVAVSIPIVVRVVTALVQGYGTVPHLFLFGGALSFVSLVEVALVLLYTGSNSPAKLWKWASRLETLLFCIVTPFAIRDQHTSAWSDLSGRVLLLPVMRMFWGCMVTVSVEEMVIQCSVTSVVAIVLTLNSPTLEVQLERAIMVTFMTFLVFFLCNILYYERRRNFMILKELRQKNDVIDYLERNGNVVSFTVEVNPNFSTTIVGVSNSCQRLYGYYPSEMIGKRDEEFVAQEDKPLLKLDIDRARKKLLPNGWGTPARHNFKGGVGAGSNRDSDDDAHGGEGRGDEWVDGGAAKVPRHLRYCRVLANGEKAWVFGVGFYTWKAGRLMLFYQEHLIQNEMEEDEKLLKEAEGDIEDEYDSYVAALNQRVEGAMARNYSMEDTYSGSWQ